MMEEVAASVYVYTIINQPGDAVQGPANRTI